MRKKGEKKIKREAQKHPKKAKGSPKVVRGTLADDQGTYSKCCAHTAALQEGANDARCNVWGTWGKTTEIRAKSSKIEGLSASGPSKSWQIYPSGPGDQKSTIYDRFLVPSWGPLRTPRSTRCATKLKNGATKMNKNGVWCRHRLRHAFGTAKSPESQQKWGGNLCFFICFKLNHS